MKVAIIGAGLIGGRRAKIAAAAGDTVVAVHDPEESRAASVAAAVGARAVPTAEEAIAAAEIVVVSTPNKFLAPLAIRALEAGKHVLIEKPMGRNLDEAMALGAAQAHRPDRVLKIGFNHRYHPALMEAQALLRNGLLGDFIFARAVYGHGGRPGYEKEWRGNADLAGGGELTDQGVHLLDLIGWFCGAPEWVFAQRRCFAWPTRLQRLERSDCGQVNGLEDNGLFMLGWANGALAQVHTSWTQWKNRFSFHVYGTLGAVEVEGLGGSYGEESLKLMKRNPKGGAPEMETRAFPGEDLSWKREWEDFRQAIGTGGHPMGNAEEGLRVMTILDAVYRSCESHLPVPINPASLNPDVSGVALAKTEHRTPTPCFDA